MSGHYHNNRSYCYHDDSNESSEELEEGEIQEKENEMLFNASKESGLNEGEETVTVNKRDGDASTSCYDEIKDVIEFRNDENVANKETDGANTSCCGKIEEMDSNGESERKIE